MEQCDRARALPARWGRRASLPHPRSGPSSRRNPTNVTPVGRAQPVATRQGMRHGTGSSATVRGLSTPVCAARLSSRMRDDSAIDRVIYAARFADAIGATCISVAVPAYVATRHCKGQDDHLSRASMGQFCDWPGKTKTAGIRLAVMDMWKPFRNATKAHARSVAGKITTLASRRICCAG